MSAYDVRQEIKEVITDIIFADESQFRGCPVAFKITGLYDDKFIKIEDGDDTLILDSKEHTQNLIKALNKAIELEWVV